MSEAKPQFGPEADLNRLIYVVDDEPMLLELTAVILEPLGFELKMFRDPEEALASFAAENRKPALVITDYSMHKLNGITLITAFRKLRPGQKILLLSGTINEKAIAMSPVQPDRFMAKPYDTEKFAQCVRALAGA